MAKPLDWEALLVNGYEPLKIAQRIFVASLVIPAASFVRLWTSSLATK